MAIKRGKDSRGPFYKGPGGRKHRYKAGNPNSRGAAKGHARKDPGFGKSK